MIETESFRNLGEEIAERRLARIDMRAIRNLPPIKRIQQRVEIIGFPAAFKEILSSLGVTVEEIEDLPHHPWKDKGRPVLGLGDHSNLFEPELWQKYGRFMGLPFSLTTDPVRAINRENGVIIPVIPGALTSPVFHPYNPEKSLVTNLKEWKQDLEAKKNILSYKVLYHDLIPGAEEAKEINREAIDIIKNLLLSGEKIAVFPKGTAYENAFNGDWHPGIARILADITVQELREIFLVPFHIDGDLVAVAAKAMKNRLLGKAVERNIVYYHIGAPKTGWDILGNLPCIDGKRDQTAIKLRLEDFYKASFANDKRLLETLKEQEETRKHSQNLTSIAELYLPYLLWYGSHLV